MVRFSFLVRQHGLRHHSKERSKLAKFCSITMRKNETRKIYMDMFFFEWSKFFPHFWKSWITFLILGLSSQFFLSTHTKHRVHFQKVSWRLGHHRSNGYHLIKSIPEWLFYKIIQFSFDNYVVNMLSQHILKIEPF